MSNAVFSAWAIVTLFFAIAFFITCMIEANPDASEEIIKRSKIIGNWLFAIWLTSTVVAILSSVFWN